VRADSAGTDPSGALNPTVVAALAERGISPKPITTQLLATADLIVTMSRHPTGPSLSRGAVRQQHWQLGFPGDDLEAMRAFCNQVDQQVQALGRPWAGRGLTYNPGRPTTARIPGRWAGCRRVGLPTGCLTWAVTSPKGVVYEQGAGGKAGRLSEGQHPRAGQDTGLDSLCPSQSSDGEPRSSRQGLIRRS
jgi:hypothetical protein